MTLTSEPSASVPANILVVDDTPANLRLLVSLLTERGHRVRPVASGELALRAVQANPPDLILLDITMPGMDGYEVCRRLKAKESSKEIPVLFLSALTETAEKVQAFQAGGVDYVTKPFQIDEIAARIQTHLEIRRQRIVLAENYRQLRELESLRDNLTHMVVHDMRSPLLGLGLSMELLAEHLPQTNTAGAKLLRDSQQCVRNLTEMATLMLDLSRLEAGKMPVDRQRCDLEILVQEVLSSQEALAGHRRLSLDVPPGTEAWIDAGLFRRVIANLVGNAIKFTSAEGHITVTITRPLETPGLVRLEVADDGAGIPVEKQAHLFEKFSQSSVSDARRGSGIGLAFVRMAVEAHGGKVGVASRAGAGSIFWLTVPTTP